MSQQTNICPRCQQHSAGQLVKFINKSGALCAVLRPTASPLPCDLRGHSYTSRYVSKTQTIYWGAERHKWAGTSAAHIGSTSTCKQSSHQIRRVNVKPAKLCVCLCVRVKVRTRIYKDIKQKVFVLHCTLLWLVHHITACSY